MEALFKSLRSWGSEGEDDTTFPDWNVVYEYHDPIEPTSLSYNFAAVLLEVEIILITCAEQTVILNDITQDISKVLGDNSNETVKFYRLDRTR